MFRRETVVTETQIKGQILVVGPGICTPDNSNLFADIIFFYILFDLKCNLQRTKVSVDLDCILSLHFRVHKV